MSVPARFEGPAGALLDGAPPSLRFDASTEFMARFVRVAPGARAAEPACGSGMLSLSMARSGARQVIGTDVDPAALEAARANAALNAVANAEFVEGDLLEPVAGPLDVVAALLPHRPAPRPFNRRFYGGPDGTDLLLALIAQARARLAPGGRLYLYVNSIANPHRVRAALDEGFDATVCGERKRYFTREELDALTPGLHAHILALGARGLAELGADEGGSFFTGRVYEGIKR